MGGIPSLATTAADNPRLPRPFMPDSKSYFNSDREREDMQKHYLACAIHDNETHDSVRRHWA
jgi:hypothetical protein